MAMKQSLSQKMLQKLSPQQIQLMKLLQVPTVELEQRIKQEIEENPALEDLGEDDGSQEDTFEDDEFSNERDDWETEVDDKRDDFNVSDYLDDETPDYKLSVRNTGPDNDEKVVPLAGGQSFHDMLEDQISMRIMEDRELDIAFQIIGNLDEAGYLRRELLNIVDDLAFSANILTTEEELEEILVMVQDLDPPGIGARDLQECLLLQLKRKKPTVSIITAQAILSECFDEFSKKHYDKIIKKFDIQEEDLKEAIVEIVKLNPKPGNSAVETGKGMQQVIPDFTIKEEEGELTLLLNSRNAPQLKVSRDYAEMLRAYSDGKKSQQDKEAIMFVKQKIDSAKWFIDAIKQRQHTLLITMDAIMNYQKEFFMSGDETKLKPMILKDIADIVQMDISTVSRVANSKYVDTPYGVYLLKYFFSESLTSDSGEEVSTREVKKILSDAIEAEEKRKPLTDEKLVVILKEKGYNIARRTIAKYREQLDIPVARLRKEL
jgi:RNA polymerase sigma-54 factor